MFFIVLVAINVFKGFEDPFETIVVSRYSEYNKVTVEGVAIREEVVVNENYSGYLMYHYENGEKVSKGLPIATVYSSKKDASSQSKIERLNKEKNLLVEAENPGTTIHANADILAKQISEKTKESIDAVVTLDFQKADNLKMELTELLCTNNIILKTETNYQGRIDQLSDEISKIESSASPGIITILSPEEGEFVAFTDGYENTISYDDVKEMDTIDLDTVIKVAERKSQRISSSVGKIITGYEWYFAALVPNDVISKLDVGSKLKLRYNFNESITVSAQVDSISLEKNNDKSVVIFKSADTHPLILSMRVKSVDLIFGVFDGIKIPKNAVRFRDLPVEDKKSQNKTMDQEIGVYALIGIEPKFRRLDVIYETDDYIISGLRTEPGDYKRFVQPDDIIVVDKS